MARANCWEFKGCGRQPGGSKAGMLGVCPATTTVALDGSNGGRNGGRACWVIAGTLCGGVVQGTFAAKMANCLSCEFYGLVTSEQGPDHQTTREMLDRVRRAT